MEGLRSMRAGIKQAFGKYDFFIIPFLKFIVAFVVFLEINLKLGYMELLNNIFIIVVISIICALLPSAATTIVAMVFVVLHCVALDVAVGAAAFCFCLLIGILLLRFAAKDALVVLFTPIAFIAHIPAVIPIVLGILRKKSAAAAAVSGVAAYCFLDVLVKIAPVVEKGDASKLAVLQDIINNLLSHDELILSTILFVSVTLIVNIVKRTVTHFTYLYSIITGAVLYILLRLIGSGFLSVSADILWIVLGTIIAALIALIIAFFVYSVDYTSTKRLQFEDDEYFYYVKAVPKQIIEEDEDEDMSDDETGGKTEEFSVNAGKTVEL